MAFVRGVFAAVATAPSELDPPSWFPLILGAESPDPLSVRRMFDLLMRDCSSAEQCLQLGVPAIPDTGDEAAVKDFCRGYVQLAQKDKLWKENLEAFALTVPFAILAGYVNPASFQKLQGQNDQTAFETKHRVDLAEDLVGVYRFFEQARADRLAAEAAAALEAAERQHALGTQTDEGRAESNPSASAESDKVARNEPCPCGSGKKYKKCCGLPN